MTEVEFLAAFESASLPTSSFRHADHLRAAFLLLQQGGFEGAIPRMRAALRRFAAALGKPDLYHETVTVAFLALVNERRHRREDLDWAGFAAANRDLFDKGVLARYYRPRILESWHAREVFVLGGLAAEGEAPIEIAQHASGR
jgi:hypothetical protein